jgi:CheY-like chemotaxis protein
MGVLVVDPSRECRQTALSLVKWVDRRHSVVLAEDGASAWKTALEWRPELILCEPVLPDISGEKLCEQLRARLTKTTFVAYTSDTRVMDEHQRQVFDGILKKPPSRFAVLSYLHAAKKQRRTLEIRSARSIPLEAAAKARHEKEAGLFRPVHIFVGMADEPALRFRLPVPEGATIGAVFRQIGKGSVTWFALARNGMETDATLYTTILEGDVLLMRT